MSEIGDAFRRTEAIGRERVNRNGWTKEQWAADAERIMQHPDGAVSALLNGHVNALLWTIRNLRSATT